MKYMDLKPQPTTGLESFTYWLNDMTSKLVADSMVKKKIEVKDPTPQVGELRIQWYTELAQAEQSGEIVTVEIWDGDGWVQKGLDAHMTVEDLDRLNEELGGEL